MASALRYQAIRKIADGGSAEVFLGEQAGAAGFRRPVVLKRIHPHLSDDATFRQMLIDEAHLAMSLHHPNLVEVLDLGESNGRFFLVLELVDGWTLGQVARRGGLVSLPMPLELCLYVGAEICRGLDYAHQRKRDGVPLGIVHRDVCPNNVLISMHAEVKITDFGIARATTKVEDTHRGMVRGKPMYMSPEQARGESLDARSDLFSVGTVLFWMLTGTLPFPGPGDEDYLRQVATVDAKAPHEVKPDIPVEVSRLIQKAMTRDRQQRFASAHEFLVALEQTQRTVLKPAGRSELEHWLRELSGKDGDMPISRQTMPPAPVPKKASEPAEPEWISLSASQPSSTPRAQLGPNASRPFREKRRLLPAVALGGALGFVTVVFVRAQVQPSLPEAALMGPHPVAPSSGDATSELPTGRALGVASTGGSSSEPLAVEVLTPSSMPDEGASANPETPDDGGRIEPVVAPHPANALHPTEDAENATATATSVSRNRTSGLSFSARLAPRQPPGSIPGSMVAILLDSVPRGLTVRVDKKVMGTTPVIVRFRNGITYNLWFEGKGTAPVRQWLMLTDRGARVPKVTLREPVELP